MAKPTTADEQRKWVRDNLSSELSFILNECEVPVETQVDIGLIGYKSVRRFASWSDDRAGLRTAIKDDLNIDTAAAGGAGTAARTLASAIVCAWEFAHDTVERENTVRAEAKVLQQHRPSTVQERTAMRRAFEQDHGKLPSVEVPSADYISMKLECEVEEPTASQLDEVTSIEEAETQNLTASLDPTGRLRITKQKMKGKLPTNSEELRLKLKLECNTWIFVSKKFTSKTWLQNITPGTWSRYADYLLGEKVANLKVPVHHHEALESIRVPWSIVLHYEYEIRKAAIRACKEDGVPLDTALQAAMKDAELKEVHFTSPLALMPKGKRSAEDEGGKGKAGKWAKQGGWPNQKGNKDKGKGKGKDKGKGKGKGKLLSNTPDGRQICFSYNSPAGCATVNCTRVHMCRVPACGAMDHGSHAHPA